MKKVVSTLLFLFLSIGYLSNTIAQTGLSPATALPSMPTTQSSPGTPSVTTEVINQMMGTEGNIETPEGESVKEKLQQELSPTEATETVEGDVPSCW